MRLIPDIQRSFNIGDQAVNFSSLEEEVAGAYSSANHYAWTKTKSGAKLAAKGLGLVALGGVAAGAGLAAGGAAAIGLGSVAAYGALRGAGNMFAIYNKAVYNAGQGVVKGTHAYLTAGLKGEGITKYLQRDRVRHIERSVIRPIKDETSDAFLKRVTDARTDLASSLGFEEKTAMGNINSRLRSAEEGILYERSLKKGAVEVIGKSPVQEVLRPELSNAIIRRASGILFAAGALTGLISHYGEREQIQQEYINDSIQSGRMSNPGDRSLGATGDMVFAMRNLARQR